MSNYTDEYSERDKKILKDNAFQIKFSLLLIAGAAVAGIILTKIFPDRNPNNTVSSPGTPTQTAAPTR